MRIVFLTLLCLTSIGLFGCEEKTKLGDNQYLIGDDRMSPAINKDAIITVEIVTDIQEINIGDIIAYDTPILDPNDDGMGDYPKQIWITTTGRIKKIGSMVIGMDTHYLLDLEHDNMNHIAKVGFTSIIGRVIVIKNP